MPIYEFSCTACEHIFDLLVFNTDQFEMKCPKCGSEDIVKQMSATNHTMGQSTLRTGEGGKGGVTTNQCGSGSCTTFDIPGRT